VQQGKLKDLEGELKLRKKKQRRRKEKREEEETKLFGPLGLKSSLNRFTGTRGEGG